MRFEAAAVLAPLLGLGLAASAAAQADQGETLSKGALRFIHGEKSPAGSLLNDSLGLATEMDPAALLQIGDDVYLDADGDGHPELIVAHAHHDNAGRVIAGLAPGVASADETIYRAEQRDEIVAGLRDLAARYDAGSPSEANYRLAPSKWLVGLQAGTFGVTEGLVFLLELWEAGLIGPVCYGIKRHEMLDAL